MVNNQDIRFPKMLSLTLIVLAIIFFIPDVVIYKVVQIGPIQESAAILFFPFVYSIADSITDVYGKNNTFFILMACYLVSLLFSSIVAAVILIPSPSSWHNQAAFNLVFGKGPWIILVGLLSFGISMYVNIKLMACWRKKMRGRHFVLRSILSSSVGELIVTVIAYPLIFFSHHTGLIHLMINAYLFKVGYSLIAAFPARFLVFLLREVDGIKQPDFNKDLYELSKQGINR